MKFELKLRHINTPSKVLLDDLKNVAKQLGKKTVTTDEYNERGTYHACTLMRRFGGWNISLRKAGLRITKAHNITIKELFDNLEKLWVKLGRQPTKDDTFTPLSKYREQTYRNRFGTWNKALEKFVAYANKKEGTTEPSTPDHTEERHARPRHKGSRMINMRLRFKVMKRDNFKCVVCGRSPANDAGIVLQIDHIVPWDKGGENVADNLQTLCFDCNIGKSNLCDSVPVKTSKS